MSHLASHRRQRSVEECLHSDGLACAYAVGYRPERAGPPTEVTMPEFPNPLLTDAQLAAVAHGMGDALIVADPAGVIVYWNAAAERVFGWRAAEAVGRNLDLIIPERSRSAHWNGYSGVMATGQTKYGSDLLRVPALHRNGHRLSIAFTVCLLHGGEGGGEIEAIAAIVRDETQRWADERASREELTRLRDEIANRT